MSNLNAVSYTHLDVYKRQIVFYVEALRENELEKFKVKFNEQQYNLQMEYYQQLKERQEEVRSLQHDVKKYILAMQAVAEHGDTKELHKIAQAATDIFERSTNVSAVGNPVVDALLNYYLRIAEKNNIKVNLDVTIPEVLTISSLSLSIILGNTFDNAIEACCGLPAEQRSIHLQLRKQYRSLFYRLENPSLPLHFYPPRHPQRQDRENGHRCRWWRRNPDLRFHPACPVQQGGRQPEPACKTLQFWRCGHRADPGENP